MFSKTEIESCIFVHEEIGQTINQIVEAHNTCLRKYMYNGKLLLPLLPKFKKLQSITKDEVTWSGRDRVVSVPTSWLYEEWEWSFKMKAIRLYAEAESGNATLYDTNGEIL